MFSKKWVVQKLCNLLGGGGRSSEDYIVLQGGRSRVSKKRLHNFEESLNSMIFFGETIPLNSVLNLAELFHRIAFLFFSIPHPLFLCQVSQRRDSITETWYLKNTWGKNFFRGWNGIFFCLNKSKNDKCLQKIHENFKF